MPTRLKVVSRVSNELQTLNKDSYFSRRTILQVLEDKAVFLLSQKTADRTLYKESEIFTHLKCFELESIDTVKCEIAELRLCKSIMKSKYRLPDLISSRYGDGILNVTSIDSGVLFHPISLRDYVLSKNRKYSYVKRYVFIVHDGFLYIPEFEVQAVNLDILTMRTEIVDELSACSKECCKSYWDYPFTNSDKLSEAVMRETLEEIFRTVKSIPVDENPNLDSNIKSATTQ